MRRESREDALRAAVIQTAARDVGWATDPSLALRPTLQRWAEFGVPLWAVLEIRRRFATRHIRLPR